MGIKTELGKELLCHTCVYGAGGHGRQGHCEAEGSVIISRGMTNNVVCSRYLDILTAETKPERPASND